MGWLWLSHLWFAIVTGFVVGLALIALMLRNGWHQTSPESLESRGFSPESDWDSNLMDPGLHRQMVPIIPAFGRRGISNTPIRRPAAQPAPGSFARRRAPTAWNGQPDRRRDRLSPETLVLFAEEREATSIDEVLGALDRDLVGLVPVKRWIEDIALLLRGAIQARGHVLLKLNVAAAQLEAVTAMLPALSSPTITALARGGMNAVETVVPKRGVNTLIPALKAAGARDILEIPISKIVE